MPACLIRNLLKWATDDPNWVEDGPSDSSWPIQTARHSEMSRLARVLLRQGTIDSEADR